MLLLAQLAAAAEPGVAGREPAAARPAVRVAHPLGGPFAILDRSGALQGLSIDTLASISARTGLRFESTPVLDVSAGIDGVRRGRFDAVMGLGRSREREEVLRFGEPFAFSPDAIVTRSDSPFLFDIRALGGMRVALARGSADLHSRIATQVPDARLLRYDTAEEAVLAVARSEADAAVVDASRAAFTVKMGGLANLRVGGVFSASPDMFIGVRRDWPELLAMLDQALVSMPAAERTRIVNRWMVLDYESDRRWQRAFLLSAAVLGAAFLAAVGLVWFNRRIRRELALRRQIQDRLEEVGARLARVSVEKSELMRTIAHDLKNPLAALQSDADFVLDSSPGDPEARQALVEMRGSIDRMRSLIGVLTDANALQSGERAWQRVPIDVGAEVRAAALSVAEPARRKGVEVEAVVASDLPGFEADRQVFREVLDNLLSNAVKFSPPGARVWAEASTRAGTLRVAVRDQGPGVAPAERSTIFLKYGVGTARPTGGEDSTGLGLWIVDRLVREMGGKVWCEEAPGGGACFIVELPTAPAPSTPAR